MPRRAPAETKLVADAMLGSLARKLRAFGFDTSYFKDGDDSDLLALANSEGRVLLTSDRNLAQRAKLRGTRALLVVGGKESQRITSLRQQASSSRISLIPGPPRCSVCNGRLESHARSLVIGAVPPSVQRLHRKFYRCTDCGRYYWRGAHWKKLRWLQRRLTENPP
jgi:uncharacterized protein with PIN domain